MIVVYRKNHLGGQILYRSLDPSKKRRLSKNPVKLKETIINVRIKKQYDVIF